MPRRSGLAMALAAAALLALDPSGAAPARPAAVPDTAAPAAVVRARRGTTDTTLLDLARDLELLAARAGGVVGIAAEHVESGERVSLNGGERFPMASVYKLPIALQLLHQVACDEVSLEDSVCVRPADLRTGSGWITARRRHIVQLSVRELLEAMLMDSDNTASDLLLRIAGGPEAVTRRLGALGVRDVRVDRYEINMALDYGGVDAVPAESTWTLAELARLKEAVPEQRRIESAMAFLQDPRDTATPDAMADLLVCVLRGQALGPDETSRLLEIMERARTGPERLRGKLPPETPVAHKTGTWSSTAGIIAAVNDVGIITLPERAGHVAIAVFVKGSNRGPHRIEHTIAGIARAACDHWTEAKALSGARPRLQPRNVGPAGSSGPENRGGRPGGGGPGPELGPTPPVLGRSRLDGCSRRV